jgi:hypothetical protein
VPHWAWISRLPSATAKSRKSPSSTKTPSMRTRAGTSICSFSGRTTACAAPSTSPTISRRRPAWRTSAQPRRGSGSSWSTRAALRARWSVRSPTPTRCSARSPRVTPTRPRGRSPAATSRGRPPTRSPRRRRRPRSSSAGTPRTRQLVLNSDHALGRATIKVLDHHRVAIETLHATVKPGETRVAIKEKRRPAHDRAVGGARFSAWRHSRLQHSGSIRLLAALC